MVSFGIGDRFSLMPIVKQYPRFEGEYFILAQSKSETFGLINPVYGNCFSNFVDFTGRKVEGITVSCSRIPTDALCEIVGPNYFWSYIGGPNKDIFK